MAKRRYSDEERAQALAALAANGGNVCRTARDLGMSLHTLRAWASGRRHPEAAQMSQAKKAPLADRLEELAGKLVDAVALKIDGANLSQLAVAMGIAIDKARLLRGEPTAINEEREDGRIAEFRKRYATALGGDATADPRTDHSPEPVLAAPDADRAADTLPGPGAA